MNGLLFIDKNGNLEHVSLEEMISDCPSRKVYEYIECLKNQLEEKKKVYTKQAIQELREEESDFTLRKSLSEEDEDISEIYSIIDEIAETVIKKYMELKERRENSEY